MLNSLEATLIYFAVFVCHVNIDLNNRVPDGSCFLMSEVAAAYREIQYPEGLILRNLNDCHRAASESAEIVAKSLGKEVAVKPGTKEDPRYLVVYQGRTLEWVECRKLSWGSAE
jgi:hypothetical protein